MGNTSIKLMFNIIDDADDCLNVERRRSKQEIDKIIETYDKILACKYRGSISSAYMPCKNPDRSIVDGHYRKCLSLACPIFKE